MACFLVAAAEAAVVTGAVQVVKHHEQKKQAGASAAERRIAGANTDLPWSRKLSWLSWLLWGGALLLAFEHVWHGEVVPWFPFLTAAANPASAAQMLYEMATTGVTMAVLVTVFWAIMVAVAGVLVKKPVSGSSVERL